MTALRAVGAAIEGEKIVWCFGSYSEPKPRKGRNGGRFWNHGWARIVRPVKRSERHLPKSSAEIRCKAASYWGEKLAVDPTKRKCGNHTCFQGFLKGRARCEIREAIQNLPG